MYSIWKCYYCERDFVETEFTRGLAYSSPGWGRIFFCSLDCRRRGMEKLEEATWKLEHPGIAPGVDFRSPEEIKRDREKKEAAEKARIAREKEREERKRLLAECIQIDGAYYTPDKTALIECSKMTRRLVIPEGVIEIAKKACYECTSLKSVKFPESLEEIEESAFYKCTSLTEIELPKGFKKFGKWAFSCAGLESLVIPDGVKEIGETAFINCKSLESVTIPASVKKIDKNAFFGCEALKNVTLAEGLEEFGYQMFGKCSSLSSITLPTSSKKIAENMFTNCTALKSITIPEGVDEIIDDAFRGCTSLESITVPASVKKIGERAFKNCTALKSVDSIIANVEEIGGGAFQNTGIKTVTIPGTIKKLGSWDEKVDETTYTRGVFACCSELESAVISEGVISTGSAIFVNCENLSVLSLPAEFSKFCKFSLYGCKALKEINFAGTKEQWKNIIREEKWNKNIPEEALNNIKVHCSDGEAKIDGSVNKFAEGTALAKEGLAIGKQTAGKICSMLGKLGEQTKQSEDVQQAVGQIKDSFKTVFGGLFGKK